MFGGLSKIDDLASVAFLAQDFSSNLAYTSAILPFGNMAPMKAMKAKAGKALTKGAIAKTIADEFELKQSVAGQIIASLSDLAGKEVKKTGKFIFPGFVMVKTRFKPATKACKKEIFGVMQQVKAKPARTIVKAFPVAALKKSI